MKNITKPERKSTKPKSELLGALYMSRERHHVQRRRVNMCSGVLLHISASDFSVIMQFIIINF